ncbi:homeodomain-like superfamily protein [Striga asiatica]|uniref:Homeodomain-like superfamily protein n=1 Tax=Striga asiatica TaxID=4170 RepID=A0A5A7NYZ0_STRAF|nr:homeodomain-like superfamily protein [Striga asiatica]
MPPPPTERPKSMLLSRQLQPRNSPLSLPPENGLTNCHTYIIQYRKPYTTQSTPQKERKKRNRKYLKQPWYAPSDHIADNTSVGLASAFKFLKDLINLQRSPQQHKHDRTRHRVYVGHQYNHESENQHQVNVPPRKEE